MARRNHQAQNETTDEGMQRPPVHGPVTKFPRGFVPVAPWPDDLGGGHICKVPVEQLLKMKANWNPESRTDWDSATSELGSLQRSYHEHGFVSLIVVNDDTILEGTRRTEVGAKEQVPFLMVLYRPWAGPSLFASINSNQKKHSPTERNQSWEKNKRAVPARDHERLDKVRKALGGKALIIKANKKKMNISSMFNWAKRAFAYCQPPVEEREFLKLCIEGQMENRDTKALRDWVERSYSPVVLWERVKNQQTLKCPGHAPGNKVHYYLYG
jgi:hypothetical protein